MTDQVWILATVLAVIGGVGAYAVRSMVRTGRIIDQTSAALRELAALNARYASTVVAHPTYRLSIIDNVNSKRNFDRANLEDILMRELDDREHQVSREIEIRTRAVADYRKYEAERRQLEQRLLGVTATAEIAPDRYNRIEQRRFRRRSLREPQCKAKVTVGAAYRSPQGRNSYSRSAELSFSELAAALERMRQQRQHNAHVAQRRQVERAKMTTSMRVDVLRRDGHCCKFCGAGPPAVTLEVDHIIPVSRGGLTQMSNLQTLCSDCNRGKSNRFSG